MEPIEAHESLSLIEDASQASRQAVARSGTGHFLSSGALSGWSATWATSLLRDPPRDISGSGWTPLGF